jgi:hypothetical protein
VTACHWRSSGGAQRLDRLLYAEIALGREQADLGSRADILPAAQARDEEAAMSDPSCGTSS